MKKGNFVAVALREDRRQKADVDKYMLQIVKASGASGIELSTLGNRAYEKFKDFQINDYGYSQFNKYVKSIDHIQVKRAGTILIAKYKE